MATYKAVMRPYGRLLHHRPALTNCKSCRMQNAALRTATGCTQDTNIQHMHAGTHTSHTRAPTPPRVTIQTKNTTSITPLTQIYNILQGLKNNYL